MKIIEGKEAKWEERATELTERIVIDYANFSGREEINRGAFREAVYIKINTALAAEREACARVVEVDKYDHESEDLGSEAISNVVYDDKFEAFRYGYNQAVEHAAAAIREKGV